MERDPRIHASMAFVGEPGSDLSRELPQLLRDAGVALAPVNGRPSDAVEILFAPRLGEGALEAVRAAVARGARRVLVLASQEVAVDRSAWTLLHAGAGDVISWSAGAPAVSAAAVAARLAHWQHIDALVEGAVRPRMVGRSKPWTDALRQLVEAALRPDATVLVSGESGTGKELAARLIHELDPRPTKRDLVVLDCTTVVPTLSGSEFFGHERGAFTDAVAAREGAFGAADGGTLFMDELGDLPLALQGELLRVVQEGMYKRVGSGTWRRTRFRLVCATHRNLREEVAAGRFRADLYHRVAAWSVRLPSLRERSEDVPELTRHLLREQAGGGDPPELDAMVLQVLLRRAYPGNVRELRQLLSRLAACHVGPGRITVGDLPPEERPASDPLPASGWRNGSLERWVREAVASRASLREIGRAAEEAAIAVALEENAGNLRRTSERLGVTDRALQMRRASARRSGGPAS